MSDEIAISVNHVSKTFKLPHEKHTSIKSAVISRVRGSSQSYESQEVLTDVSFEIKKGEFFAIVGRNGSGKSTLLKMLAGIYSPTSGSIDINGKLTPFIELGVGFNPELTGRENVFLNGALLGFGRKEMEGMYDDIVEFAELRRFMDQKLKNYSSGMQVRLAFSIAIRANSDILLLDEVLAVGDAAFQQKCFNYFENLKAEKKTVVFVSHSMDAVRRFCTQAIYIENGRLTHKGTPAEIADIYLEENMEKPAEAEGETAAEGTALSARHSLRAKLANQTTDSMSVTFSYSSKQPDEMYIGLSLIKDGISFAELNSANAEPLTGSGQATYTLDTNLLNGGMYEIGAGLFRKQNAELLAITKKKIQFIVKGNDPTKGGALKLADNWKFTKDT